jgi:oxalate decarboxylase/phosphoglucose isomerase-like protein (cupin superfamily)
MHVKVNIKDIGGDVVKEDDRYKVVDNKLLNNLVLSSTDLKPKKQTTGHAHVGQEEVYNFVKGSGTMELIDLNGKHHDQNVKAGDVVLIPDGWFHRVHAGPHGCYFVCVFDGRRTH